MATAGQGQAQAAGATTVAAARARARRNRLPGALALHILLLVFALLWLFPFIWMLLSSFKGADETFHKQTFLPQVWYLANYPQALKDIPYLRYALNTFIIAGANVLGTLLSCTPPAYALSRLRWPGRDALFVVVLSTMLLPYPVTIIPLYVMFSNLGLVNTFWPLIIPGFFGNAFYIFLLRQFFRGIPAELNDAGLVDGASELTIFLRIIVPLSGPVLSVVALLTFLANWTDFFGPLIYLQGDSSLWTLSLGLRDFQSAHFIAWGPLMAASVMFMLPVILLFLVAQRTFVQGIALTGLKG
jgi:ABC-type glycerol-3-phosphate transport system permease component